MQNELLLSVGTAPDFAMRDGAVELRHKAKMSFYREGAMFRQEAPNDRSFVRMLRLFPAFSPNHPQLLK